MRDYSHPDQLGQEKTPTLYVERLTGILAQVARVLRPAGTLWLNLGDCYGNDTKWGGATGGKAIKVLHGETKVGREKCESGVPPKSLVGIPWRVAFALMDAGWSVRNEIVWEKPNPMPAPVKDRYTASHEKLFLMTRAQKYYFDAEAIAEACVHDRSQRERAIELATAANLTDAHIAALRAVGLSDGGKNARCQNGTGKNTPEVFALAEIARSALGGYAREFLKKTSGNVGRKHGDAVGRDTHMGRSFAWQENEAGTRNARDVERVWAIAVGNSGIKGHAALMPVELATRCIRAGCPPGGTVLDPFGGAMTTLLAAQREGREGIAIELNPEYAELGRARLCADAPLFAQCEVI